MPADGLDRRARYLQSPKGQLYKKNQAIRKFEQRGKTSWFCEFIKISEGCLDCGYNKHPEALHFDHVPGSGEKTSGIADLIGGGWLRLLTEIAKCDVVCANCHAIRTANRRAKRLDV